MTYSNWDCWLSALHTRLLLAREKTHTVERRACLVRAIAIPKINYVARHCWPPPVIIHKLQGFIKDFFWGKRNERRSRPWVQEEHGALSIREGGMSTPRVRTQLITLAASIVGTWATLVSFRDKLFLVIFWGGAGKRARARIPRAGETTRSRRSSLPYGLQGARP